MTREYADDLLSPYFQLIFTDTSMSPAEPRRFQPLLADYCRFSRHACQPAGWMLPPDTDARLAYAI